MSSGEELRMTLRKYTFPDKYKYIQLIDWAISLCLPLQIVSGLSLVRKILEMNSLFKVVLLVCVLKATAKVIGETMSIHGFYWNVEIFLLPNSCPLLHFTIETGGACTFGINFSAEENIQWKELHFSTKGTLGLSALMSEGVLAKEDSWEVGVKWNSDVQFFEFWVFKITWLRYVSVGWI